MTWKTLFIEKKVIFANNTKNYYSSDCCDEWYVYQVSNTAVVFKSIDSLTSLTFYFVRLYGLLPFWIYHEVRYFVTFFYKTSLRRCKTYIWFYSILWSSLLALVVVDIWFPARVYIFGYSSNYKPIWTS